jgi:hypothetical protein
MQMTFLAAILARANAGSSMAARMPMIAMTMSNSIRVNPEPLLFATGIIVAGNAIAFLQPSLTRYKQYSPETKLRFDVSFRFAHSLSDGRTHH